jgi:hypothetical protein
MADIRIRPEIPLPEPPWKQLQDIAKSFGVAAPVPMAGEPGTRCSVSMNLCFT